MLSFYGLSNSESVHKTLGLFHSFFYTLIINACDERIILLCIGRVLFTTEDTKHFRSQFLLSMHI